VSVDQATTGTTTSGNENVTGDQIIVDIPQDTIFINTNTDQPYS
jgi:hypothetical protein